MVSTYQYISSVKGRLPHTYGRQRQEDMFCGGTIFTDHVTGYTYIHNQITLREGDTLQGKTFWKNI